MLKSGRTHQNPQEHKQDSNNDFFVQKRKEAFPQEHQISYPRPNLTYDVYQLLANSQQTIQRQQAEGMANEIELADNLKTGIENLYINSSQQQFTAGKNRASKSLNRDNQQRISPSLKISSIQTKLTIEQPDDKSEQEADRVAREVVQPIHRPAVSSQTQAVQHQMQPMEQRVADGGMAASPDVESGIRRAKGGGQPLMNSIREPMEQAFDADFSRVRIHTDAQSDQLNQSIQAKAFTTGQDVFFRSGEYNPGSRDGQELIAHELAHVVQQGGGTMQRSPLLPQPLQPAAGVLQRVTSAFPEIEEYNSQFHKTSFLARVNLTPIANSKGNETFMSTELWASDVKISNDRPPTKFGSEGQRSHTVAWSLLCAAIQGLGGQPLNELIAILDTMVADLQVPTNSPEATEAAKSLDKSLKTGLTTIKDTTKLEDFSYWQLAASELVSKYVHAYQLSEEATYADGRAVGHGEAGHMATLREAESLAKSGTDLTSKLEEIKVAAVGMLDFKARLAPEVQGKILSHWINDLFLAFPILMSKYAADIVAQLSLPKKETIKLVHKVHKKSATRSVEASGTPAEVALPMPNRSTFTANVVLTPTVGGGGTKRDVDLTQKNPGTPIETAKLGLMHYQIKDLDVTQLDVADDRPNTRFGALQRSHTVAWTLIRRHLMHFKGKPALSLVNFVLNELTTLKTDIDTPEQNKKIGFDAPAQAEQKRTNLVSIVDDTDGFPLFRWQILLSELVETYITLYQLSRSATYSKEENPKGHGESNAISTLQKAETDLAKGDISDLNQYYADNKEDILTAAAKLVDATVATSSLKPDNWKIAIEHWLHLVKDQYPTVTKLPKFSEDIKNKISVMEPQDELLAGYKKPNNEREKVLINLYENAKLEVKSVPNTFEHDLYSSIRLSLAEFKPPDHAEWTKAVDGVKLNQQFLQKWFAQIKDYSKPPQRRTVRDIPDANAIVTLIEDATKYFKAVEGDCEKIINFFAEKMLERAGKLPSRTTSNFITTNMDEIRNALGKGINEALELSSVGTIENYKAWYDLFNEMDEDKEVNYASLSNAMELRKRKHSEAFGGKSSGI